MKAIQIRGAGDVVFCDVADPEPQPGEVLIRVRAAGICGTDVEIVEGSMGYFTTGLADYPIVPGHEWSGEIVLLGTDVANLAVGDRLQRCPPFLSHASR